MSHKFPLLTAQELAQPAIYCISDLHLCAEYPHITQAFKYFLQNIQQHAAALYILGDLFDVWVGDDDDSDTVADIMQTLSEFSTHVPSYFIPGNRDVLVDNGFYQRSGLRALPDETVVTIYNERYLLAHGDSYCLADTQHQRLRQLTKRHWLRRCFCSLPLSWRRHLTQKLRQESKQHQQKLSAKAMDVDEDAVKAALKQRGVRSIIHGHTHNAHHHSYDTHQRIVLGDWGKHNIILRIDPNDNIQLVQLPAL